ncbi:MAG: cytochrome C [Cyclobacteriaceae bacterium]
MSEEKDVLKFVRYALRITSVAFALIIVALIATLMMAFDPGFFENKEETAIAQVKNEDPNQIENGIHVRTGLVEGEGLMTVVNNCTHCHSSKLIIQNRMSAERWNATIRWMQETQNLGDLGENQATIVKYLTTYYPVKRKGRREKLTNIDWYEL